MAPTMSPSLRKLRMPPAVMGNRWMYLEGPGLRPLKMKRTPQALMLHREAFSKSRAELDRCEADLKKLTEERNYLKLLIEQKEEEVKGLRAKLATTHKTQIDLIEQKAKKIEQLREEAKMKEAETLGWRQNMDRLASEKDAARAQLSSAERQLQSMKEEILDLAKKIEELEVRLAAELAKATSEAEKVKADIEAVVAIYRADAEAVHARAKEISDAAQRLEEIHARGFDLTADIDNAKVLEAEAKALLSDDDDSGSASGSESGKDEDEAPGEE
uniref:Fibrinogen- and Ig-binding protein-like n=1 Tax=Nicotiana tabacum TaxID=4097 RepID=A0A1S4AEG0_TOBAC|nr:PREDICTED: fibrinogen- and Ig-binding protein-like [Nicotiana tabacum]